MTEPTVHACAVVIGEAGVLIRGKSGSGKSSLAFALVEGARQRGLYATFVADDRVVLHAVNGRVIARCPETILGLAERWGRGIETVDCVPAAVIRLVADLVEPESLIRLPETADMHTEVDGVSLPRQAIPARKTSVSLPVLQALLAEMNKI